MIKGRTVNKAINTVNMNPAAYIAYVLSALFLLLFSSLITYPAQAMVSFSNNLPSESIGTITQSKTERFTWDLELKNDNNNDTLPATYRNWWYVRADHVPVHHEITLRIKKRGFPYYYLPVYSYDNRTWHFFERSEVSQPEDGQPYRCDLKESADTDQAKLDHCYIQIRKQFDQSQVWLARFYPYPIEMLEGLRNQIKNSPYVTTTIAGLSPQQRPIWLFKIGSNPVEDATHTVWIHARTHPHETGAGYVAEGLIQFLLSEQPEAKQLRSKFTFYIVPMHNPDGVALGNYRTNAESVNLETQWIFDQRKPKSLLDEAPIENKVLNQWMQRLLARKNPPVLALNIHATNEPYDTPIHILPHFSENADTTAQRELWRKQMAFLQALRAAYHRPVDCVDANCNRNDAFLTEFYPETWWWANAKHAVNAITLETVYGSAGMDHQLTVDDLHDLGRAIGLALHQLNSE